MGRSGGGGRSGGFSRGSGFSRSSQPSKPTGRAPATTDDRKKNVSAPVQAAPQQGGALREMGVLAGGIAGGHIISNVVTNAIFGSRHGASEPQVQDQQPAYQQPAYQQQEAKNPCEFQLQQFLNCAENQYDLSMCEGFKEALKECRISYSQPRY